MGTKLVASKLSYLLEESESYTTLLNTSLSSLLESTESALENLPPNATIISTLASLQSTYSDVLNLKRDWEKKTRSLVGLKDRAANQLVDSMFPFATHYMDSVAQSTHSTLGEQDTNEWQEWRQLLDEYQIQLPLPLSSPGSRSLDETIDQERQEQPEQQEQEHEQRQRHTKAAMSEHTSHNDDDGLIMTKEKTSFICPITQQPFVAPMVNPACKHSYSHSAILQLCARGRGSVPCPVAGCDRRVDSRALIPNHSLERAMRRDQKRRANQTQDHHHGHD